MKRHSTKRALIASILILCICFTTLIGTTFAWFTDSVTSSGNVIKSGKLDVELYWADGKEDPTAANWNDASNGAIYTADQIWEPGYTDAKHIKVANEGTLALKYQLTIVPNGEVSDLADVIDVYYIEGGAAVAARTDLEGVRPTGTLRELINKGISRGTLTAGANYTATIVLKMQEDAGNEHQELSIGSDFSIQLIATQVTYEEDSFGNSYDGATEWYGDFDYSWYDADATELEIGSAEQLAALAALVNGTATSASTYSTIATAMQDSFKGKTITITSDIDLANIAWAPIGNWDNAFEGVLDGNGYTIHNLYINAPEAEDVGLIGCANNSTIKNLTINNANVSAYSCVAAVVGTPYTGCTISNCHVTGDINLVAEWAYVGGICAYGYTKLDNCSVIADGTGYITSKTRNAVGGISAWLLEDASAITNCEVKNLELTGWANIGAITGFMHRLGVIDGCSAENVVLTKTRQDGNPTIGLAAGGWNYNATKAITITNNTFKNITLNGNYVAIESADILYGAEYYGNTNSNFIISNNTQENITNNLVEVVKVTSSEDLIEALTSNKKSFGVILTGDVDIPISALGQQTGGSGEYKLGGEDTETITIDLNGYKMNITTNYWSAIGAKNDDAVFTIKNGTMTSSQATGTWNSYDLTFANCNYVIENVVFDKAIAFTNANKSVSMTNVTINETHDYYALWISAKGQNVEIDGLTVNSAGRGIKIDEEYVNDSVAKVTLNVSNAVFNTNKKAAIVVKSVKGADITLSNVNIENTLDTIHTVWVDEDAAQYADLVTVTGGEKANEGEIVVSAEDLQSKLDKATGTTYLEFINDITGDVTVTQKPDVKITIDGNGKTYAGVITVDGKSARYESAALTIQNVNFNAESLSADAFIRLGHIDAARYTNNVTVKDCTFSSTGEKTVAVKSYTGGDWNVTLDNLTVNQGMHSLAQLKNVEKGLKIVDCKVYSKNGVNVNNSCSMEMEGCTFDVKGYAVRFGSDNPVYDETFTIKNSTLKSACAEAGDAVIEFRGGAVSSTLTLINTTITGTTEMKGNTSATIINKQ